MADAGVPTGSAQAAHGLCGQSPHMVAVPLPRGRGGRRHGHQGDWCHARGERGHRRGEQRAEWSGQPMPPLLLVTQQHTPQSGLVRPHGHAPGHAGRRGRGGRTEGFEGLQAGGTAPAHAEPQRHPFGLATGARGREHEVGEVTEESGQAEPAQSMKKGAVASTPGCGVTSARCSGRNRTGSLSTSQASPSATYHSEASRSGLVGVDGYAVR